MIPVALVVAMADNGVIGVEGRIPWRIPADMRHFKAVTMGKPCVMGRKTWESLPKKPLPGRTNIVVTRDHTFEADGAIVMQTLNEALLQAGRENPTEIMIIGGAEIYNAVLRRARLIYLTEVHEEFAGDTRLVAFDRSEWLELSRESNVTAEGLRYSFVMLERRS